MHRSPFLLGATEHAAMTQEKGVDPLASATAVVKCILARAHQIAHRFVLRLGNVDRPQRTRSMLNRQRLRITPVGLDSISRLLRHPSRRYDRARTSALLQVARNCVRGRIAC